MSGLNPPKHSPSRGAPGRGDMEWVPPRLEVALVPHGTHPKLVLSSSKHCSG